MIDVPHPACENSWHTHDVGLCAGPFQVPEPISSERPTFEHEPERTIDYFFEPVASGRLSEPVAIGGWSDPEQLSFLDASLDSNSILNHSSQNPLFHIFDQPHTTGNTLLANNSNPLSIPGGRTDLDVYEPPLPSSSPSDTFGGLHSNVTSLGSIPTQPTFPSLVSQVDVQRSSRLLLSPGGKLNFTCSVCASAFASRYQLRYVSPPGILPLAHANFAVSDAMKKTTKM